jgi:hypothetical protein
MAFLRHVGIIKDNGHRVVVIFRQLPNEATNCLVVETDSLQDRFHSDLMNAVESRTAQESVDFFEYANRQFLSDGSNMLQGLHDRGFMRKYPTRNIIMRPAPGVEINLEDLNNQLSAMNGDEAVVSDDAMDNKALAANLRSQADMYEQQAKDLRKQAEELDPTKRPVGRPRKDSIFSADATNDSENEDVTA